jgi:hypothetical protein
MIGKSGAMNVIAKITNFKQAVAEGDIEKRIKAEDELRGAFNTPPQEVSTFYKVE